MFFWSQNRYLYSCSNRYTKDQFLCFASASVDYYDIFVIFPENNRLPHCIKGYWRGWKCKFKSVFNVLRTPTAPKNWVSVANLVGVREVLFGVSPFFHQSPSHWHFQFFILFLQYSLVIFYFIKISRITETIV